MGSLAFDIHATSKTCHARTGRVVTPHGCFDTPAFAPVGTQGTVKGLLPDQVASLGSQVILANTYHLMLRPGPRLIEQMGGLHTWARWKGPIVTDSGGYQVFSLADVNRITDQGVTFKSHLDGQTVQLTPERSIEVQNQLGADIIMAFDDCPPASLAGQGSFAQSRRSDRADPSGSRQRHGLAAETYPRRNEQACRRTVAWLDRCVRAHRRADEQALFGIVQGGLDLELRSWCAAQVTRHDLPGYAIGGVAVGEGHEGLRQVVRHTTPLLPEHRPRYLMGVGYERDILVAVQAGVDLFDCVLPTRNGRNANAFTCTGAIRLKNATYACDERVIDPRCDCPACGGGFSRSYLRHLFMSGEMLAPILVSCHNIRHFQRYLLDIRRAITHNDWSLIQRDWPVATGEPPCG